MWRSSLCTWGMIRSILKIRVGSIHTAKQAHTQQRPYSTANGPWLSPTCPICAACHPFLPSPEDTLGHWLGECSHPMLSASYIARHNRALCSIQSVIAKASPTPWFTIMDATSASHLPFGVHSTRLPAWLFAHPPGTLSTCLPNDTTLDQLRYLLRPDILIIHGLSLSDYARLADRLDCPNPDTTLLSDLRTACTIHIVELTFTTDASYNFRLEQKKAQHYQLVRLLLHCGWTIHSAPPPSPRRLAKSALPAAHIADVPAAPPSSLPTVVQPSVPTRHRPSSPGSTSLAHHVHIFILTYSCTIPANLQTFLKLLQVPPPAMHTLLHSLAIQLVRSTHGLICLRRRLERDPATFKYRYLPTPPISLHRYHEPP